MRLHTFPTLYTLPRASEFLQGIPWVSPLLKDTLYLFPVCPACTIVFEKTRDRMVFKEYASALGWARQALVFLYNHTRKGCVCVFPSWEGWGRLQASLGSSCACCFRALGRGLNGLYDPDSHQRSRWKELVSLGTLIEGRMSHHWHRHFFWFPPNGH